MTVGELSPVWPVAATLGGTILGLAGWVRPRALLAWAVALSLANLIGFVVLAGRSAVPTGLLFLVLAPSVACLSLLGQPAHPDNRAPWLLTLLFLGLGEGILVGRDGPGAGGGTILLGTILSLLGVLIYWYRAPSAASPWRGVGACAVGVVAVLVEWLTTPPTATVARLIASAVLFPLIPLHGGFVASLAGLPGNLPAFLAFLLPALGLHGLLVVLPELSDGMARALEVLGIIGTLYGAVKALLQPRMRMLLAYAGLSFGSILWWYAAAVRTLPAAAVVYVGAVGLAISGLLVAWYAIRARYGDTDLRAIRGLARPMPRFAVLFVLLALAALGLPPFGVYAGFMGLLLAPSLPLSGALLAILLGWLAASWYVLDLTQHLIFGEPRSDLRYRDLRPGEFTALVACVLLLLALGLLPPRLWALGQPT